jgi:hypothetical protein
MRRLQLRLICRGRDIVYMKMDHRERLQMARLRTSKLAPEEEST